MDLPQCKLGETPAPCLLTKQCLVDRSQAPCGWLLYISFHRSRSSFLIIFLLLYSSLLLNMAFLLDIFVNVLLNLYCWYV